MNDASASWASKQGEMAAYRLLIEDWAQATWEADAAGVVVADSPSWRAYTGQTIEEWLGYGWLDAVHPDDRLYAERQWREAMAAHTIVDAEFRLRSPDGGWRWTNVRAAPVLGAEGRIDKWVGLNIDIDTRKRAEAALGESENKYRTLFESIDDGLAIVEMIYDQDGEIVDMVFRQVNGAYERQGGIYDVVGRSVREMLPGVEDIWLDRYKKVATTGEPIRVEDYQRDVDRWFEVDFTRVDEVGRFVAIVFNDITERKRAELVLRESEERQAFLLKFSDALRAEPSVDAMAERAIALLSSHMGLDRCYITYYRPGDNVAEFPYQVGNATVPPLPATVRLSDFPEAYEQVLDGTFVIEDDLERRGLSEIERANSAALGMRAMVASTVRQGEKRPLASLAAVCSSPRKWTAGEVALVEEVAERTWSAMERARAETAQRESEERFRQFAQASASGLWIRDAATLAMEYVSPAVGTIYGLEADALLGDVARWASHIVPDDRETALRHLEEAREGQSVVHEFRVQRPSDGMFRWIRNTDFPLSGNGHVTRIGGIAEDITEARLAVEHQGVLLAELQHRVRNIMAIIRSIVSRTAERAGSVGEYAALLSGRLLALARVQALLTRAANVSVGIGSIVRDEVSVQAQHEGQYVLDGPDIALSPKAAEVLTLAVHELATNALKYGALSVSHGKVTVRWDTIEKRGTPWLVFDWSEEGAPERPQPTIDKPRRVGFGSELIEGRVPYELRGKGKITIEPGGARCHLEFPLKEGASVLETGAPQQTIVYGGALDMTGEADLSGHTILVVEDDFYLATDTARALKGAGANVLGPCSSEDQALDEVEDETPSAAVVDINLGPGPSFKLARRLAECGIPFVFVTGYDEEVIPSEFDAVPRLQKPLDLRRIVAAIDGIVGSIP